MSSITCEVTAQGAQESGCAVALPPRERPLRRVGVVGLGRMGGALALNLSADGYDVTVYDRHSTAAASLQAVGARAAGGLSDLAQCDAVVTVLPDDDALSAVSAGESGLLASLKQGAIHISMSTVSPGISRQFAAEHAARNQESRRSRARSGADAVGEPGARTLDRNGGAWLERPGLVGAWIARRARCGAAFVGKRGRYRLFRPVRK